MRNEEWTIARQGIESWFNESVVVVIVVVMIVVVVMVFLVT